MAISALEDGVSIVDHALAQDALCTIRSENTPPPEFRAELERVGRLTGEVLCDEHFDTETVSVRTPLADATGERVTGREDVVLVNVLRAATPMVEGLLSAFPSAKMGAISASRDEAAGRDDRGRFPIDVAYEKLPAIEGSDTVVVADPMLATGSTMSAVLDAVKNAGPAPARLFCCSIVAAPAGIERVRENHPETHVVTLAVDDHLDDHGFIVPGLGDAGDRAFNTN
jgi:uracil phosphoribosyltransferase